MSVRSTDIAARLDAQTRSFDLLTHPFYVAWTEGRLTTEDLSFYSEQYFRQVEAFPTWLETLVDRLPDGEARTVLTENLADEIGDDHAGLWLEVRRSGRRPA